MNTKFGLSTLICIIIAIISLIIFVYNHNIVVAIISLIFTFIAMFLSTMITE